MLTDSSVISASQRLPAPLALSGECIKGSPLFYEQRWRRPEQSSGAANAINVSRWTDLRNYKRMEEATTPADQYVIGIALKSTRVNLVRGRQGIFDGVLPAGALLVSAPSTSLRAHFQAPYDFLHFYIPIEDFPRRKSDFRPELIDQLNDLILVRDPFAEQLAKMLVEERKIADGMFLRCIGQTLAMHVAHLEVHKPKVNALPKWRLRLVEDHIKLHFDRSMRLSDLARIAGLSRMHFAAQFRAATGYKPREYILHQRVERAKSKLSDTNMPIAEVALSVGFCTQAHFSTVFKRLIGDTPARWRISRKNELAMEPDFPMNISAAYSVP